MSKNFQPIGNYHSYKFYCVNKYFVLTPAILLLNVMQTKSIIRRPIHNFNANFGIIACCVEYSVLTTSLMVSSDICSENNSRPTLNRSSSINSAISDNSGSENLRQRLDNKSVSILHKLENVYLHYFISCQVVYCIMFLPLNMKC